LSERPELVLKVATSYTNAIAVQNKHRTQCRRIGAYHHLHSKTKAEKNAAEMLLRFKGKAHWLVFSKKELGKKKGGKKKKKTKIYLARFLVKIGWEVT